MNLIIGASQYFGNKLYTHLHDKNRETIGTYFKNNKKNLIYFDVSKCNINNLGIDLRKVKNGFICSGISNIEECKKNYKEAYKINILGNKNIIKQLWDNNINPIFISSDAVYEGIKGNYNEKDEVNPVNIYGQQKKIIEDFLIDSKKDYLILRLSKIYGKEKNDKTLLTSWIYQLLKDQEIPCATDQKFSPIFIGDLLNCIDIMIDKNLRGIYNMASGESFTRFELVTQLKNQLNINSGKIKAVNVKDLNFLEPRPIDTSMDCKKIIRDTKYVFPKIESHIQDLEKLL